MKNKNVDVSVEVVAKTKQDAITTMKTTKILLKKPEEYYIAEEASMYTQTIEPCSYRYNSELGLEFTIISN